MKVKGLLLTVDTEDEHGFVSIEEIEEMDVDGFYRILNCSTIDIVTRKIGNQTFDIVCDDEALLKGEPRPSAFNSARQTMLFGNLFVCKSEGAYLASLTDDEIVHLKKNLGLIIEPAGQISYPVLMNVDYV